MVENFFWSSLIASSLVATLVPITERSRAVVVGKLSRIALSESSSLLLSSFKVLRPVSLPIAVISLISLPERSRLVSEVTFSSLEISVSLLFARLRVVRTVCSFSLSASASAVAPLTSVMRLSLRVRVVSLAQPLTSGIAVSALP